MRGISVTALILTLVSGWAVQATQIAFEPASSDDIDLSHDIASTSAVDPFAESIVSTLTASSNHTIFLRLLQRAKCIPLLAHIGNATVFAPTDDAWKEWFKQKTPPTNSTELYLGWLSSAGLEQWGAEEQVGSGDSESELDNQNWALRQHLLYHMFNYTLTTDFFVADHSPNVTIETTLLFPMAQEPDLPPTPPPGPPWLPRGGEGMLGGHGQRLRIAKPSTEAGGPRGQVGVNHNGEGGASIWDGSGWAANPGNETLALGKKVKIPPGARWTRNGIVIGLEGVLEPPPSLDVVIRHEPSLSYLAKLLSISAPLPSPLPEDLATAEHLTIFAPSNDAFEGAFDEVEKGYLEGGYGSEGFARIFGGSVLSEFKGDSIGWSDRLGKRPAQVISVSGLNFSVQAQPNGSLLVNDTEASAVDIYGSNGVLHIVPSLLLPANFTLLNSAEKVLLSVNATRFVSLLRSANLSSTYIGEPGKDKDREEAWTILAPTDDVLDMMDRWGSHGAPPPHIVPSREKSLVPSSGRSHPRTFEDVSPIAALLQYHIIPGRLTPSDIHDGLLIGTELRTSALKGGRQRLRVDVSPSLGQPDSKTVDRGEIRFGGAAVLGQPVRSGRSVIYLMSSLLSPPEDVLQTAVSDLQLSTFVAAVYAADLDRSFKKLPAISYLVPRNRAFTSMGLAMKYLLLSEGKDELRKVVRYHAIDGVVYSDGVSWGKTTLNTIEGGEIVLERTKGKNASLSLSSPRRWPGHDSGEDLPANGELRSAHIAHMDALTSTGVIHTIDNVMLPADVSITIGKLVRGSRHQTMAELMFRAGLSWILEGREPTSEEVVSAMLDGVVEIHDDSEDDTSTPDVESLAMPSYTLLVPTDKAFSRINLTRYVNDRDALLNLLKLHIIPTQPKTPTLGSTKQAAEPPKDGVPLSLGDDLVYSTLLSGDSKYGDVAFRATGDNSYIVGIRGARGGERNDAARIGATGRASVRWRRSSREGVQGGKKQGDTGGHVNYGEDENLELWRGGLTLGGGVLVIDSVLIPYEPGWFSRWGWLLIMLVGVGIVLLVTAGTFGWWWLTRRGKEEYERLEGEEEE